jgi:hypothetical protein
MKAKKFLLYRSKKSQQILENITLKNIMLEIYRLSIQNKGHEPCCKNLDRISDILQDIEDKIEKTTRVKTKVDKYPFLNYSYYSFPTPPMTMRK